MVEDDLERFENNLDKNFVTEIEKRSAALRNGSAKTYTWEEVQHRASEALKLLRKQKLTENILKLFYGMNYKRPGWETFQLYIILQGIQRTSTENSLFDFSRPILLKKEIRAD